MSTGKSDHAGPPPLTAEIKLAGLRKATAARRRHAEISGLLKSGAMLLEELLDLAATERAAASMRVLRVLESMPGVGKATAPRLLDEMGISTRTRVGGLGRRQRSLMLKRFPGREALSKMAVRQAAVLSEQRAAARAAREEAQ